MSDRTNKDRAWELFLEGNKLADQKHIEKAIASYQESIELYPGYEEVYNNLGVLLHDLGKFEEATAMFEKGVSVAMQNSYPFTERELATILAALRLFQEARRNNAPLSEHFEEIEPLTTSEIEALCERLNTNTN